MGVKKLNKFLSKKENSIFQLNSMKELTSTINHNNKYSKKKIFAIDTSLYLYKYVYSYSNFLVGFINQIVKLLENDIIPIYVFEGTPPTEKNDIIRMRFEKKNKLKDRITDLEEELNNVSSMEEKIRLENEIKRLSKQIIQINKTMIDKLKELLDIFNISYIDSVGESDSMCAYLYKNKFIDATISDDMDILVSGCNNMIKFDYKKIILYDLENITKILDINYERFVDMCVIFGCDYVKPIPKLSNDRIYDLICTDINLEEIIGVLNNTHINTKVQSLLDSDKEIDESIINNLYRDPNDYIKAKDIFINSYKNESFDKFKLNTFNKIINVKNLQSFIHTNTPNIKKYYLKRVIHLAYNINDNINESYDK